MSRIGKKPIPIPQGVKVQVDGATVRAEGPKGRLTQPVPAGLTARVDNGALHFEIRGLDPRLRHRLPALFPELPGVVNNAAKITPEWRGAVLQATWPLSDQRSESPTTFPLVLVFDASLRGRTSTAGPLRAAPAAIRGAVLIRMHGVWLWARRLRIQPRPDHHQEGVR